MIMTEQYRFVYRLKKRPGAKVIKFITSTDSFSAVSDLLKSERISSLREILYINYSRVNNEHITD